MQRQDSSTSHQRQAAPLLPDDSAAAQVSRHHHQTASHHQDIRRGSKGARCQQAQVVTLLHHCPHSHAQNSCSAHLKRKQSEWVQHIGSVGENGEKREGTGQYQLSGCRIKARVVSKSAPLIKDTHTGNASVKFSTSISVMAQMNHKQASGGSGFALNSCRFGAGCEQDRRGIKALE